MAKEVGSIYYSLGIKGAADFSRSLEQARQAILKLPKSTTTAGATTFDTRQLSKFGKEMDRVMRSSAATFKAEMSVTLTDQASKMKAMLAQLPKSSAKHKAIKEISDIQDASAAMPGQQKASVQEIIKTMRNKERFELAMARPTTQRVGAESTLRGFIGQGKLKDGEEYTDHLRTGLAALISQEGTQNRLNEATKKSNASIASAQKGYEGSAKSASDLLSLQRAIVVSTENERREREKITSDQRRMQNQTLDISHPLIDVGGKKYSSGTLSDNRSAYSEAKSSRQLRLESAAFAGVESDIADKMKDLNENYPDQTTAAAKALKLEIDQLIHKRDTLAELIPLVDDYVKANGLAPTSRDFAPGSIVGSQAISSLLSEGSGLSGQDLADHTVRVQNSARSKEVQSVVSGTRYGRFASIKDDAEKKEAEATNLLSQNTTANKVLTDDQKAMLESHVREMGKLKVISQKVIDIMKLTTEEEKKLAAARANSDKAGEAKHLKNLKKHTADLQSAVRAVNEFNNSAHDASESSGRWNYQMQEVGYGIQDFVQVMSGGGGLASALRSASNNFSQFFAAAGGPQAAAISTAVALGVLGMSIAIDQLGSSTEKSAAKIDDLIERLKVVGELNAEYSKGPATEFSAMMGENVSLYGQSRGTKQSIDQQVTMLREQLKKEMIGKGMGSWGSSNNFANDKDFNPKNQHSPYGKVSESGMTFTEMMSAMWNRRRLLEDTEAGPASNELQGTAAEQGVWDRILRQRFEGGTVNPGRDKDGKSAAIIPQDLRATLNKKGLELERQLLDAHDLETAIELMKKAGVAFPEELNKTIDQLILARGKIKELEDIQGKAVAAYERRAKLISGGDRVTSEFSGEYASGKQSEYAREFMESVKSRQEAGTPEMKRLAARQGEIAAEGFRNASGRGKFEGPASELAGVVSPVLSEHQKTVASLNEVYMSDTATKEEKTTADEMIQKMKKELPGKAFAGMRSVASSYSPTQRIGEFDDKFTERIDAEVAEMLVAITELGKKLGLSAGQADELKNSIQAMGQAAKENAGRTALLKKLEFERGENAGKFGSRDEKYLKSINESKAKEAKAISDANTEFITGGSRPEERARRDARINEATVEGQREREDLKLEREKADRKRKAELFSANATDRFNNIGNEKAFLGVADIKTRQAEELADAREELRASGNTPQAIATMKAKERAIQIRTDREINNIERGHGESRFGSRSALGGYIANLIGGRDSQRYQAQMTHAGRLARIEGDENLSDDEKKAQANIESKLFGFEMEKIDRKNVSFTDVGSIWKTIQGSLKDDYSKKMSKEFHEYMELAKDRGVKVRLAIGN